MKGKPLRNSGVNSLSFQR